MSNQYRPIPSHVIVIGGLALILIAFYQQQQRNVPVEVQKYFEGELKLVLGIQMAKSPEERDRLITQLEAMPIEIYPFFHRWLIVQKISPFECWTDAGYDPSQSEIPRDIQLLAATYYGMNDIGNGGYDQFFSNSTGVFAPEMVEWFERADMKQSAEDMRRAMALFGSPFPRSQEERRKVLDRLRKETGESSYTFPIEKEGEKRNSWDEEMKIFEKNADRWLQEKYGITKLRQKWNDPKE